MAGRPYTDEDRQRARELAAQGLSRSRIARMINRSRGSLSDLLGRVRERPVLAEWPPDLAFADDPRAPESIIARLPGCETHVPKERWI